MNISLKTNTNFYSNKNNLNKNQKSFDSFRTIYASNDVVSFKSTNDAKDETLGQFNKLKNLSAIDCHAAYQEGLLSIEEKYRRERARIIEESFFAPIKLFFLDKKREGELSGYRRLQELISKIQDEVLEMQRQHLQALIQNNANLNEIMQLQKQIHINNKVKELNDERIHNLDSYHGFAKIAGYEAERCKLEEDFVQPMVLEKSGEVVSMPNAILFFGPTGTGKTTLAKALSEETGCPLVTIMGVGRTTKDSENDYMSKIVDAAQKSQERFLQDRTRTLILLDELDSVAYEDSYILPKLKKFLQSCSEDYHCTVLATTNYPERIPEEILSPHRIPLKIAMGPSDKDTVIKILKHYLEGRSNIENLDYAAIADQITSQAPNAYHSNSDIELICTKATDNTNKKFSTEDLIDIVKEMKPVISQKDLEQFEKDKALHCP